MIAVGETAPDFTLPDQDGEDVSLSGFRGGRVLLIFYPFDFSGVCSDQLSVYQEVKAEIEEKGVTMVGISVDNFRAHKVFQEQLGTDIPLLSDYEPKGEVAKAYGSYFEPAGCANRTLVLIDADGVIEWTYESPSLGESPGANVIFDALA